MEVGVEFKIHKKNVHYFNMTLTIIPWKNE